MIIWKDPMDPHDIVDYIVRLDNLLEGNESVLSYSIKPVREALAMGLVINPDGYKSSIDDKRLQIWFGILELQQENVVFDKEVILPIELTIVTNSTPPRRKQRTLGVKVVQQ